MKDYSWETVKESCNYLYRELFNDNIEDFVGQLYDDNLPRCVEKILAFFGANPWVIDETKEIKFHVRRLGKAYRQIKKEGKIG